MLPGVLDSGGPLSLISQLGPSEGTKFSYCLMSTNDSPSKTSPLFIGQSVSLKAMTVRSTPIFTSTLNPTFYYLSLEGINVGGRLLNIRAGTFDLQSDGSGRLIIDSGTTVTWLQSHAYDLLRNALKSSINLPHADGENIGLDLCWNGSSTADFPIVTFHFRGADYDLSIENYILFDDSGVICLTMLAADNGVILTRSQI